MVLYECIICNFSTDKKTNYIRHTKTKKHKKKSNIDIGIENIKKKKNVNHVNQNVNRNYKCPNCNSCFTTRQAKSRHIKQNRCKINKDDSVSFTEYKELMTNMMNKLLEQKDKYSRDMLEEKEKSNQMTLKLLESKGIVYNKQIKDSFNVNNTNYVLQFYNYNDADSMNSIIEKFKLTKDEYVRAALTSTYQGALLEKADKVIIEPYMKIEEKRPIHTVDSYRQKALYKDDNHHKWTQNPDTTLKDCFDNFHKSAIEQRDKIILENQNYVPESNEDDLYKQIYFIPTEKKEKDNIHKKAAEYVHNETKINKSILDNSCEIIKI